jgi:transposase
MRAYSNDLRERVIAAWQDGKRQGWIATTYRISLGSVKRYIRRYKATGRVAPTVQRRAEPRIRPAHEPALQALVAREPVADLPRYCEAWQQVTGIVVSTKTMSRMLVRLGLRQKNDGRRAGTG